MPKPEIEKRIARAAQILHIEPLLKRKPAQLSGGQRQRVAIGRALVRDVDVFLFDEPLSNLDAKLRTELRVEIKRLHSQLENTTMIYVTHDQIEAMTLADRIAIMRDGRIQQLADPQTIYNKPDNKYVADFIGSPSINFISGTIENAGGGKSFKSGGMAIALDRYAFRNGGAEAVDGKPVVFGIRPEQVAFGAAAGAEPFSAEAEVEMIEPMGADSQVWCRLAGSEFRFRSEGLSQLARGSKIRLGFDPARASMFDAQTELRI
jgi:multiple sugar transport system ATP-binding protein